MKLGAAAICIFICLNSTTTNASPASVFKPHSKIVCSPNEYKRVGLEGLDGSKPEVQIFEYGGKVKVTKDGNRRHYSYEDDGQDFFELKEKYTFTSSPVNVEQDLFIVQHTGWDNKAEKYILKGEMKEGFFHIDLKQGRYYGYTHKYGAIDTFAGTCVVVKD